MTRWFWAALAGVWLLAGLTAAAAGELPEWQQRLQPKTEAWRNAKQELIFNSGAEPETLDPHQVTALDASLLVDALFEGLVAPDPVTLEPRPSGANAWEVSADGKVYTFHLRPEAQWSDGRTVTSADYRRSVERVLTPATGASYATLLYYIDGAEALHTGRTTDFATLGVETPDPLTVRFRLVNPCGFFLELLVQPVFYPVRADVVAAHGAQWTEPAHLVGNGAFVLAEWRHRDRLIFKKNRRDLVRLERVDALCVDDLNTAYQLFLAKQLHWMPTIPRLRIEEIKRNPDSYVAPFFGTYFFRFNVTKAPFDQPRVRRALAQAIDREEITDRLLKGGEKPVGSYCPPVAGYEPAPGLKYDPEAARRLLAEAGFPEGRGFPPFELRYNTDEGHKQIAEAVAQQWKRNLGLQVVSRNSEWKVFLDDMKNLSYAVCRASWIGDYGDPSTFFDCFASNSGNNRCGFANAEYDGLLAQSRTEQDKAKRLALFTRMEQILVEEECPIAPVYRYVNRGLLSESVGGFTQNIRNYHPLKYLWLE